LDLDLSGDGPGNDAVNNGKTKAAHAVAALEQAQSPALKLENNKAGG